MPAGPLVFRLLVLWFSCFSARLHQRDTSYWAFINGSAWKWQKMGKTILLLAGSRIWLHPWPQHHVVARHRGDHDLSPSGGISWARAGPSGWTGRGVTPRSRWGSAGGTAVTEEQHRPGRKLDLTAGTARDVQGQLLGISSPCWPPCPSPGPGQKVCDVQGCSANTFTLVMPFGGQSLESFVLEQRHLWRSFPGTRLPEPTACPASCRPPSLPKRGLYLLPRTHSSTHIPAVSLHGPHTHVCTHTAPAAPRVHTQRCHTARQPKAMGCPSSPSSSSSSSAPPHAAPGCGMGSSRIHQRRS